MHNYGHRSTGRLLVVLEYWNIWMAPLKYCHQCWPPYLKPNKEQIWHQTTRVAKEIGKKRKPLFLKVHIPTPQKYQLTPSILCCFILQFCPILLKSSQVLQQNLYFSPLFSLLILLKCSLSFPASCLSPLHLVAGFKISVSLSQTHQGSIHFGALLGPATKCIPSATAGISDLGFLFKFKAWQMTELNECNGQAMVILAKLC